MPFSTGAVWPHRLLPVEWEMLHPVAIRADRHKERRNIADRQQVAAARRRFLKRQPNPLASTTPIGPRISLPSRCWRLQCKNMLEIANLAKIMVSYSFHLVTKISRVQVMWTVASVWSNGALVAYLGVPVA